MVLAWIGNIKGLNKGALSWDWCIIWLSMYRTQPMLSISLIAILRYRRDCNN